jgi:hypothetical protein
MKMKAFNLLGTLEIIFLSNNSIIIENQYKSICFGKIIYINRNILEKY